MIKTGSFSNTLKELSYGEFELGLDFENLFTISEEDRAKIDKHLFQKSKVGISYKKLKQPLNYQQYSNIDKEEVFLSTIGNVYKTEVKKLPSGILLYTFSIVDVEFKDSLIVQCFANDKREKTVLDAVKEDQWFLFQGKTKLDTYGNNGIYLNAYSFQQMKGYPLEVYNPESKKTVSKSKEELIKNIMNNKCKEISKIDIADEFVSTIGQVFKVETRVTQNDSIEFTFYIADKEFKDSLMVKKYANSSEERKILSKVKKGQWFLFQGVTKLDTFKKVEIYIELNAFQQLEGFPERKDNAEVKRVELNLHTKMSIEDSIVDHTSLVGDMMDMGYTSVAITDQDCSQALPVVYNQAKDIEDFKVINGVKMTTYIPNEKEDDLRRIFEIRSQSEIFKNKTFIVFDIETTGLNIREQITKKQVKDNSKRGFHYEEVIFEADKIIEIGAVKVKNGKIIEEFQELINPNQKLTEENIKIHGIKDKDLEGKRNIKEVMPDFLEFIGDFPLVAHNITFDGNFIENQCYINDFEIPTNRWIDTLEMAKLSLPNLKKHKLDTLVNYFNVKLENHHRALDDAKATMEVFYELLKLPITFNTFNILIYMKNNLGRNNMNQLMTKSFIDYLEVSKKQSMIPKFEIENHRENLIVASSGIDGEVFLTLLKEGKEKAKEKAKFYDFLDVQPVGNYLGLVKKFEIKDEKQIIELIKDMIKIGEELNIPVVATGNVKNLKESENMMRESMLHAVKRQHSFVTKNHFLTTEEMLNEFDFLSKEKAFEIVVTNSNLISDMIEKVQILPNELMLPHVEQAQKEIEELALKRFKAMYGTNPHPFALERLQTELDTILGRLEGSVDYSVLYWASLKAVQKAKKLGYITGSRGSVGSSFLAFLTGITDVNSLAPHYICPKCFETEFVNKNGSGVDLEDKECPKCETLMLKDGHNIPLESFIGYGRIKPPDIDLNFSALIQTEVHEDTGKIFNEKFVKKAGTIGTISDKMIEKISYSDINSNVNKSKFHLHSETKRFDKVSGVKRSTGQHAGGLIVFPQEIDPSHWMPFQYSAHNIDKPITTHYDYHSLEESFVKLDFLGHDSPTIAKMYEDMILKEYGVEIDYAKIPLNDKDVISTMFRGNTNSGISEFLTHFVGGMLDEIKPTTFDELVRISGLSHGTNVWYGNARDLVMSGEVPFDKVIACRDDIMLDLIEKGVSKDIAFAITDKVRKGRGVDEEYLPILKEHGVEDWYINSCNKIKYMFPKAHAVAYVSNSVKQAWVKYYYPKVFYSAFFSMKTKGFKWEIVSETIKSMKNILSEEELGISLEKHKDNPLIQKKIKEKNKLDIFNIEYRIKQLEKLGQGMHIDDETIVIDENGVYRQDDKQEYILLIALKEAIEKGIKISEIDFNLSHPTEFRIHNGVIIPPLVTIKFLGEKSAPRFAEYRDNTEYTSFNMLWEREDKEDVMLDKRALLNLLKYGNLIEIFDKEEIKEFVDFMEEVYDKRESTPQIKITKNLIKELKDILA